MKNIQKVKVSENSTVYSYEDENGIVHEVEIVGIAKSIIDVLGESLLKESFLDLKNK